MQGRWIVVDADRGDRKMTLLQIGQEHFDGVSVRKQLSQTARRLLLHNLDEAATGGAAVDEIVEVDGTEWRVIVDPVVSPLTSTPVGAMGIFVRTGEAIPDKPLLGALEWRITPEGREAFWDRNIAEIYDIQNSGIEYHEQDGLISFPSSHWMATFVGSEDQHKLQRLIDEATHAETKRRARISYVIEHPKSGCVKTLEFSAQNRVDDDGTMYFVGLTREIPHQKQIDIPDDLTVPQPEVSAIMDLTTDVPMAQVKTDTSELVQMLPGWRLSGLSNAGGLQFLDMVDGAQRNDVQAMLRAPGGKVRAMTGVKVRHIDGRWVTYVLLVKNLGAGYVMIRLKR